MDSQSSCLTLVLNVLLQGHCLLGSHSFLLQQVTLSVVQTRKLHSNTQGLFLNFFFFLAKLTHIWWFTSQSFVCYCEKFSNGSQNKLHNASKAKPLAGLDFLGLPLPRWREFGSCGKHIYKEASTSPVTLSGSSVSTGVKPFTVYKVLLLKLFYFFACLHNRREQWDRDCCPIYRGRNWGLWQQQVLVRL